MACPVDVGCSASSGSASAGCDEQLQLDEVEAGDHLRHRVLDLEAGVHLEERELAVAVEQELDGAGADVADGARRGDRGLAHPRARSRASTAGEGDSSMIFWCRRCSVQSRSNSDVDVAVRVGEHLDLDVAATLDVALDEHRAVAERRLRLPLGARDLIARARRRCARRACRDRRRRPTPSPAPAARSRASDSTVLSGSTGTPADRISALAPILEPIASIADAGGPMKISPASVTAAANSARSERKP